MLWFYFYTGDMFIIDSFSGKIVCIDGCYGFDLFTKLVDSDGSPLANTEVIAFIDQGEANPSDNHPDSPSFTKTDSEGNVQLTAFTGIAWGGIYRPGLELPPRPLGPHTPKILYFWHKDTNDQWHQTQINIEDKHINRTKHDVPRIHIDKIQVKEEN
jgi:hypothetical protein